MTPLRKRLVGGLAASLLSLAGLSLTMTSEGERRTAYPDPGTRGAPYTICYGHTAGVRPGQRATHEQCLAYLHADLAVAERAVQRLVRVPLRQGEYDAYTDFVFNVGEGTFSRSTMLRLLNNGQHTAACNQFPHWKYADKRVLSGLVIRRTKEQTLCLQPGRIIYVPSH